MKEQVNTQSISEYFYQTNQNDPTTYFDWEYILIDNKKIKNAWCFQFKTKPSFNLRMEEVKLLFIQVCLKFLKNKNGLAAVMGLLS